MQDYLLAKDFNIVFEAMVDELIEIEGKEGPRIPCPLQC